MMLHNNAEALLRLETLTKADLEAAFGAKAPVSGKIVGALYNQDTDGVKNILLHCNPAGVIAGLKVLTVLTGARGAELVVSCPVNEQELQANAGIAGLNLTITEAELVNKAIHKGDLLVCLDELASMAEVLVDRTPGVLVSVDGGDVAEVDAFTPVSQLIGQGKGVLADHKFLNAEEIAGLTVGQLASRSGALYTVKTTDCVVSLASREVCKLRKKSCGKCTFCREGLYQLSEELADAAAGRSKAQSKAFMADIAQVMTESCNCTLGDSAGLPVLTMLRSFENEADAHILRKKCPAGVCLALTQFYIDPGLCKGDGACASACPTNAITYKPGYVSVLDTFDCSRCGACLTACPNGAVKKTSGKLPQLPSKPQKIRGARVAAEEKTERVAAKRQRIYAAPAAAKKEEAVTEIKKTEKVQGNIVKTITTELVIVAGGPAGLAAAIAAGEKGIKSIILEKSGTTGGAANMGMGPLGIDTKIQRANFNNITVEEALRMHMDYTHYAVDEDLVQTYFNKSADTIEWLEDMGVEFAGAFRYFKESAATWHIVKPENGVIGPRAASAMVKKMTERARELGCQILFGTPAQSLIQENGKVCGAVAVDAEGNGIEVRGKAVLVATGGFGNNKEMIKEHFGLNLGEDFFPFQIPGITGDGLRMMWEVGAAKFGANIEAIYQIPDNLNWFLLDAVLRQPNLLINQRGDRFMNEGMMGNTTFTGNAIHLQPGNYAYCIMDEGILKEYKRRGPDIVDIVHPADAFIAFDGQAKVAVEQGYPAFIQADTIAELAEKLGIDEAKLQDTIDEYNEMCEAGVDTKFYKDHRFLHPITGKGKYLVGKYYLAAYGTVGGVRINKYCEVLDNHNMPIEGLYSAGSDANTIYGDSYNFTLCGNTMGFAVNTGRMAGESIADYIHDLEQ